MKKQESTINSYLVDADTFSELGEPVHIDGVISPEKCKRYAKHNHRMCEGRGILNFDDAKVFIDNKGKRQVLTKWRRTSHAPVMTGATCPRARERSAWATSSADHRRRR